MAAVMVAAKEAEVMAEWEAVGDMAAVVVDMEAEVSLITDRLDS